MSAHPRRRLRLNLFPLVMYSGTLLLSWGGTFWPVSLHYTNNSEPFTSSKAELYLRLLFQI